MRQFTIAKRLSAAVLLPLAAMVSVPFLTAALMPFLDEANASFAEIFIVFVIASVAGAVILVMARGFVCPLAQVADTLDAIAYAELDSVTLLQPTRGELARLTVATDRLADVIGERQRRELVSSSNRARHQRGRRTYRYRGKRRDGRSCRVDVPGHEGDHRRSRAQRWRRFSNRPVCGSRTCAIW